jgi:hypothetical protein
MPKFELYKHNDEFFNKYYGIFYELGTFADFDRLCKLGINKQKSFKNLVRNREPPKDDSGQVWFKLAQWFQRRRFSNKFTDGRRTPSVGNSSHR